MAEEFVNKANAAAFLSAYNKIDAQLRALYNTNLFFCIFYSTGLTIDTEELVLVTSRSTRYYVSAAYWDRDSLLWAFPAVLDADPALAQQVKDQLSLENDTLVLLCAGTKAQVWKTSGVMVKMAGAQCEGHMDAQRYEFCWIVDFPLYEIGEESGQLEFCHNPFSMPSGGLEVLLKAERGEIDPLSITADQYDLVCNGVELSSGAVRNHDPEIMIKAFEMVRLGEEDVKAKFPAMYNAFTYGAPPHAGIAPGVDRMVMLLAGEDSIREIIPFPMNKNAQDVMMSAPSEVTQKQLDELHIAIVKPQE